MERQLIVNADDFGQSEGVNRGILRAHREGIVTSASLMVRWPAAESAVRNAGDLALGLHIDLGEWAFRNGEWIALYERVSLEDPQDIEAEICYQLEEFCRLTGKTPTHIDSHQHVHLHEPVRTAAKRIADELSVPLRGCNSAIRYCGRFYGQSDEGEPCPETISLASLIRLLAELGPGVTELGCHPGEDEGIDSTYCHERSQEVQVLCDPRIRENLVAERIRLCAFADVAHANV
jgi:predicted glycoside hydrolase/deacetylase ChbG (UPF0249 family)